MSSLYGHLTNEDTCLPSGYCLYGDNAYVNNTYMAVPYPSTSSGPKDAYNYFHLQVRFHIECVCTILVNMWELLKIFFWFFRSGLISNVPLVFW